jgi:hypothetical protein
MEPVDAVLWIWVLWSRGCCEESGLVECDAASLVNWFLKFQRFMVPSSSRLEQSKSLKVKAAAFFGLWATSSPVV